MEHGKIQDHKTWSIPADQFEKFRGLVNNLMDSCVAEPASALMVMKMTPSGVGTISHSGSDHGKQQLLVAAFKNLGADEYRRELFDLAQAAKKECGAV